MGAHSGRDGRKTSGEGDISPMWVDSNHTQRQEEEMGVPTHCPFAGGDVETEGEGILALF